MSSAAQQLDMLATTTGTISTALPGGGRGMETYGGAWRAKWIGGRYGWVMYRLTTEGWEPWEPDLPYGQSHIYEREEAEQVLLGEAVRYGDRAMVLFF